MWQGRHGYQDNIRVESCFVILLCEGSSGPVSHRSGRTLQPAAWLKEDHHLNYELLNITTIHPATTGFSSTDNSLKDLLISDIEVLRTVENFTLMAPEGKEKVPRSRGARITIIGVYVLRWTSVVPEPTVLRDGGLLYLLLVHFRKD